jgi:hypothetical protein
MMGDNEGREAVDTSQRVFDPDESAVKAEDAAEPAAEA